MPSTQEFFTRQHEHLNQMETKIVKTRTDLESARSEALDSLKAKRERAAAARQSFQSNINEKVNMMKASVEGRQAQTEAAIEEWKRKREVNKLENRARDLEEYAEAAMAVLNLAQEEAAQASLDAVEARRLADGAQSAVDPA
jgi:hypothetical protein